MRALIFGAGGHGRIVLDILRDEGLHQDIGFVDEAQTLWGQEINGAPVIGGLEKALEFPRDSFGMVVALGNPVARMAVVKKLNEHSVRHLNAIHPSAVVMPSATVGAGNMICAGAIVNSGATVKNYSVINTASVVEHDTEIGDGVTICPGAQIGGRCKIAEGSFVGTGAIVLPRVSVGAGSVIGAGAIVTRDVPASVLALGTPARVVEQIGKDFNWQRLL